MIRDNDPDPGIPGGPHRLNGRDSAIARDDERCSGGLCGREPGGSKVIAIAQAMGQERNYVCTGDPERTSQQSRRALSVHVVVTVNHDAGAGANLSRDDLNRLLHSCHGVRVGQVGEERTEITACRFLCSVPSLYQQGRQRRRQVEPSGECFYLEGIGLGNNCPPQHRCREDAHQTSVPRWKRIRLILPAPGGTESLRRPHKHR